MKRVMLILITLIGFGISMNAQEQKPKIAVINLYANTGITQSDIIELTSLLTTELVMTKRFRVIERSRVEQIIEEQHFQASQITAVQAAKIGRLLGVEKIITGEYSKESVSIRVIDVQSGDIEAASSVNTEISRGGQLYSKQQLARFLLDRIY